MTTFRDLHERDRPFVIPNPWVVGSARVLASMGFEALATTSAGYAFSQGMPEGVLGRDQVLSHCRDMVNATDLPVSADLEKGFGDDPETVSETVRLAAETGLAGCSIEDSSGDPSAPIFDRALAKERIVAAVETARALPNDFVLTARSENFLHGRPDLDDTIARLQDFEDAGADVLYAPGLQNLENITAVCKAVSRPVNVVMELRNPRAFALADLSTAGVKRVSIGSVFSCLALGSLISACREIQDTGTFTFAENAAPWADLETIFKTYVD